MAVTKEQRRIAKLRKRLKKEGGEPEGTSVKAPLVPWNRVGAKQTPER